MPVDRPLWITHIYLRYTMNGRSKALGFVLLLPLLSQSIWGDVIMTSDYFVNTLGGIAIAILKFPVVNHFLTCKEVNV